MTDRLGMSPDEDKMRRLMDAVRNGEHAVEYDESTDRAMLVIFKMTMDDNGVLLDTTEVLRVNLDEEDFFKTKSAEMRARDEDCGCSTPECCPRACAAYWRAVGDDK
jgi:hypothetical protein